MAPRNLKDLMMIRAYEGANLMIVLFSMDVILKDPSKKRYFLAAGLVLSKLVFLFN